MAKMYIQSHVNRFKLSQLYLKKYADMINLPNSMNIDNINKKLPVVRFCLKCKTVLKNKRDIPTSVNTALKWYPRPLP